MFSIYLFYRLVYDIVILDFSKFERKAGGLFSSKIRIGNQWKYQVLLQNSNCFVWMTCLADIHEYCGTIFEVAKPNSKR